MDFQPQVSDPSLLGFLAQAIMPSEAEAAGLGADWQAQYLLRRQLAMQEAQQRGQQQEAALNKPSKQLDTAGLANILQSQGQSSTGDVGLPGDVLSGGPSAPITFGRNPRTGVYEFNNLGYVNAPGEGAPEQYRSGRLGQVASSLSSPEALQNVEQEVEKRKAAPSQAAAGGAAPPQDDIIKHARIVNGLTQAGYSPTAAKALADSQVPSVAQFELSQKNAEQANKPLTPEQTGKLWKFNPATREFDPVPPELTSKSGRELQAMGYRTYSDKQRAVVDELKDVDVAFQQLRSAVKDIQPKNAVSLYLSEKTGGNVGGPEGAIFRKASTNFTTIFDKFLGGVRGAASPQMQAIRAQVLPQIYSTGQVSDRLMGDLQDLIQTMGDSRLKSVVGGTAFNQADVNRKAQQVLDTFQAERGGAQKPNQRTAQQPNKGTGKQLDQATAAQFLNQAGGDKNRARALARQQGYTF